MRYPDIIESVIIQRAGLKPWLWMVEYENVKYLYIRKTTRKIIRRIVDKNAMVIV